MSKIQAIKTDQFDQEVLQSSFPVLVDFWAPWCNPCLKLAPELEAINEILGDKVKIVKIDVDEEPEIAEKYGVQGIPNMSLFKEGKVVDQMIGFAPRKQINTMLAKHISGDTNEII